MKHRSLPIILGLSLLLATSVAEAAVAQTGEGAAMQSRAAERRAARAVAGGATGSASSASITDSPLVQFQRKVLQLVNEEREKHGLGKLRRDVKLEAAAQAHARDMAVRHYFRHETPEGRTARQQIAASGYALRALCACSWASFTGQNIARGQTTAAQVVREWMNSPEHRANILSERYIDLGVGYAEGNDGPYWVQDFGALIVK